MSDIVSKPLDALNIPMNKTTAVIAIFIIFLFVISLWVYRKVNRDDTNCSSISKAYKDFGKVRNVDITKDGYTHNLLDYYVKTAYNACSGGQYKNDFVNICALENVIKQGARGIDLQIYSLDDEPVIATSSVNNYTVKETYNSVMFNDALTVIRDKAFSGSTCPNPGDPLILHLRIMSNNKIIYEKIASSIEKTLHGLLMGPQHSYENNGKNFGQIPLPKLVGKVIIIVDKSNPLFESSKMDEYVNLTSNSMFMRTLRNSVDVKYCYDKDELKTYNMKNMSIVMPDVSASNDNYSADFAWDYGCQFIAMSFQNLDSNMKDYHARFEEAGSAYILKPDELRYIKPSVEMPI